MISARCTGMASVWAARFRGLRPVLRRSNGRRRPCLPHCHCERDRTDTNFGVNGRTPSSPTTQSLMSRLAGILMTSMPTSRNRDHVAAFTARSSSRSQPRSTPRSARTTAPAISMVINPETVTPTAGNTVLTGFPHDRNNHRHLVGRQRQHTAPRRLAPTTQMLRRHVVSARYLRHHRAGRI